MRLPPAPALLARPVSTATRASILAVLAAMVLALVAVVTTPASAAIGAPVLIDDFGGLARGRTVTTTAVPEGTTSPATFSESGGVATTSLNGDGNGRSMLQLDYDFPALDLTAGVSNTQFFMEFDSITRNPFVNTEPSLSVTINVRDSSNRTASYNTGIQNVTDFNIVLNFECTTNQNACFKPETIDFTSITHVQVQLIYPRNFDPTSGSTTAVLDRIRTTPPGGVQPPPPTTQITPPAGNPVVRASGSTVDVEVDFRSNGVAVPVTSSPVTQDGLLASDVQVTSTVPGASTKTVSGGPSDYVVTLGPLTGSGQIRIDVPAGAVVDAWAQDNAAGTATFNFVAGVPPAADATRTLPAATAGTAYSQSLIATGNPTPTWSVTSGSLPPGLTLSSAGLVSGTPTTGGNYSFTASAANSLGTAAQAVTLQVRQSPAFTSANATTFTAGSAGSFTVTTSGLPTPGITSPDTPPEGVSLVDNSDGTATLSGTPAAGTAGVYSLGLTASNGVGTAAQQTFTLTVHEEPAITSASSATFDVGEPGAFTVTTTGLPRPAITVQGALPPGITLVDNGDGTATLGGTPTSNGSTTFQLTATNSVGSDTQQFRLDVRDLPTFTSADGTTFTVGALGTFTVTTAGFPTADLEIAGDLPEGVTFTDNDDGTGTLAGTPEAPGGVSELTLTATNSAGSNDQPFTLTVNEAPTITSADEVTFVRGEAGSFTVTTAGFPRAELTIDDDHLPPGVTFTDNDDGTGTLAGTPEAPGGLSELTLTATNSAGSNDQPFTLTVNEAPTITSDDEVTFVRGEAGSFTVTTAGFPRAELTIDEDHLPPGVTFTDNDDGTGTLAGTPEAPGGVSELTLTATNLAGSNDQPFTLTINEAPTITSADEVTFVRGEADSFTVTTDGFPASTISFSGALPDGLSLVDEGDGTATISGTPTGEPGSVTVSLLADNNVEPDATQTLSVVVQEKPAFTSAASASFVAGTSGSFTLTTTGDPVPELTLDGVVPPGLTFTDQGDGTATLSGTPTAAGVADLVVTASNDAGDVEQQLTVRIDPAPVPPTPPGPGITPTPPGPGGTPTATCLGALATVVGGTGDVVITGTPGNDVIVGGPATTKILGGAGDDVLCAVAGAEVWGGAGDDVLRGGPGDDRLLAGPGNDVVSTWGGLDIVLGGPGGDAINGNWGDDKVWGQSGDDELLGRRGEDLLLGGRGDDEVLGGRGPDQLFGGPDSDRCHGGLGPDTAQQCEVESGVPRVKPRVLPGYGV